MSKPRHIVNISGGKDSSALAIYLSKREFWRKQLGKTSGPEFESIDAEYVFCDTQEELPETYDYLKLLEAYLGKAIVRLTDDRGFKHWLQVYGNYLPSPNMRWCTRQLKLKPFEDFVGDDAVYSYVGIRADEDRDGYISTRKNIIPIFPFKEDGIVKNDVIRILNESGAGLPSYYKWRTRSGCYFCFFQRKVEWVGLMEEHPDLYEKAKEFEKINEATGQRFTWSQSESLEELAQPERVLQIKSNHAKAMKSEGARRQNRPLVEVLAEVLDAEDDDQACNICHI